MSYASDFRSYVFNVAASTNNTITFTGSVTKFTIMNLGAAEATVHFNGDASNKTFVIPMTQGISFDSGDLNISSVVVTAATDTRIQILATYAGTASGVVVT